MTIKKPTPKQIEALKQIAQGQVYYANHGHGAWRIHGAMPSVVGRVVSLGWAKLEMFKPDPAVLTEAGRAVLAEASKQDSLSGTTLHFAILDDVRETGGKDL